MLKLTFPKTTLTFLLASILLVLNGCSDNNETVHARKMPGGSVPEKLFVINVNDNLSWADKNMLSCFQGLVNRKMTRIYYNGSEHDQFWLDYYQKTFNINNESIDNIQELLERFAGEIDGYIVYPQESPHLLNIATTIGALENLIPATSAQEELLQSAGLQKKKELKNTGEEMIEIYRIAVKDLLPECNQTMLAAFCVHEGHWPTSTYKNRDYAMAHNVFSFDISSSERDKADYNLLREIYKSVPEEAIVFGWHCVRDKEHEAIGLVSEFGHYGMCSLQTPNLTVHSSIPVDHEKIFRQREINPKDLKLEDKVYVAYMATDGDAAWFMLNHVNKDWSDKSHGQFKYNWGFLPLAYDLMPGTVQYYLENMKPGDYFVCGPAGATYTYPFLHPTPEKFLNLSNEYMQKCGLATIHMTNWNDRDWWQEVELPGFHDKLKRAMPGAVGFVRGMGESAFEEHFLGNGQPYIFCGEGIHRGDDVYKVMKDFIDACPNRPLLIYSLVNHSVPMGEVKAAMDRFSPDEVEAVHLDELLLLADKAFIEGKITADLYPEKEGLKDILAKEAKQKWPAFFNELKELEAISSGSAEQFNNHVRQLPIGSEITIPGDFLAFNTIWYSMTLVKLSLESKGIYVNHKPSAAEKFLEEFEDVNDAGVVGELQKLWENWHQETPSFTYAQKMMKRLVNLTEELDKRME
jgi:hypothetical protein